MTNPTNQLPTPEEEEAWREMEKRAAIKSVTRYLIWHSNVVVSYAQEFIDNTPKIELGIFTLRKAFEMGFIRGVIFSNQEEKK